MISAWLSINIVQNSLWFAQNAVPNGVLPNLSTIFICAPLLIIYLADIDEPLYAA